MELTNVRLVADGLAFPEGPVALGDGSVIVMEINGQRITRIAPDGRKSLVAEARGGPNGAAIGPDGALYVCNSGGIKGGGTACIQRVDIDSGKVEEVYRRCSDRALVAPNDLVFDETGNFWFTDFGGNALYYASPDGARIELMIRGVPSPNGVGLSPDGRTVYWAQTHTRQVMRRRLSAPGEMIRSPGYHVRALVDHGALDPFGLLAGLPGARELDSLAVDAGGFVCVGTLVDSGVSVISADGASVELWTLPEAFADRMVTNICFGGRGLTTAYITCSETGRLVACDWPRPGLALAFSR